MATPYLRRSPRPYRDPHNGGALTWERQYEDSEAYLADVSELLDTGETFSAVALEDKFGVTATATITAAGSLVVTVTEGRGSARAKLTVTTAPKTLEDCYAILNDVKDQYEAHRIDTTYHSVANTTDAIAAADATTFDTAVTLADELKADYNKHRTDNTEDSHQLDDDTNDVDATGTPTTLAGLVTLTKDILAKYLAHIEDTTTGFHAASPDTTNRPTAQDTRTMYVPLQWRTPTLETGDAYA